MYCSKCGSEIHDQAVVCIKCGCPVEQNQVMPQRQAVQSNDDTMSVIIKIFMILGCLSVGWAIIPLAWCIPMTISVFNSLNRNEPISTGMKVCVLLFVNLIAGICLLCRTEPANYY